MSSSFAEELAATNSEETAYTLNQSQLIQEAFK
jgi:hypothetical protein